MNNKGRKLLPRPITTAAAPVAPPSEERKNTNKQINIKSSAPIFAICVALMVLFVIGRWIRALSNDYYGAFVQRNPYIVAEAARHMKGLEPSAIEQAKLLPLQQKWDLFTSSRLRDEVTISSYDGTELHGYIHNENSNVTLVVLPRYHQDGNSDFLPGTWLNERTACNILMPDPRNHGGSGGSVFSFGYFEQHDLVCWLEWAEQYLGKQTFILWGEGSGANTILFAEAGDLLPDSVAFAVAESPFASLHELAEKQIYAWYKVPSFPFFAAIEWKVDRESGFRMSDTELSASLDGKECDLPILFLQSEGDEYILPQWSQTVLDAYLGPKDSISGNGSHGTIYPECKKDIEALLEDWLTRYIP